jgi:ADP-heptose:LPS heptosyltransferase
MALSTEKNPIENASSEEVKVIAIKLPFDLQERLLSFPFLHQIHEKYPEADIHLITPKIQIEVLNLLPFQAYYHEFDEDEIETVFDVHRYTVTAKIYNVDLFISLTNSFVDACLGMGLRARMRLGFSDGWKAMLLTHKVPRLAGHHLSEDYFSLYKELVGENIESKLKVMSRDLTSVIQEWDTQPYIAINLSPIRQAAIEEEILELINHFEDQRIVLFSSEDQDKVQLLIEPFMERLSKRNNYVHFIHKSWIELAKMLAFSRGVITFNGPTASLSAYVGAKTVIMYESEDPQRFGPFYFLADILVLGVNDPTLVHSSVDSGVLKKRKMFNMSEVFGKAFEFFRLMYS